MAFNKARADAQKILGKDAKIPKDKSVDKDIATANKGVDDVHKASEALEASLLAWKKAVDAAKESAQAFGDDIDGTNFDLDGKDPTQKKQIADAQKVFADAIGAFTKNADVLLKVAEEVYKSVSSTKKRYDELSAAP